MSGRRRTRRPGRGRRLAAAVAVLAAAAAAVAIATGATTRLETYGGASADAAPEWTAPCYRHEPRPDRELLERCARATGVVAYVLRRGTAELEEVHFALVGRYGALIVKLEEPTTKRQPALGERVSVTGPLVRASNGMREIQTWWVG